MCTRFSTYIVGHFPDMTSRFRKTAGDAVAILRARDSRRAMALPVATTTNTLNTAKASDDV
ncbi:hypothetical protein EOS_35960 [Caballeronia mineralivorans PML1(12)]|uniref:Uncharacterized protein n=1 Tax=Caballeronia mineralivorans PML1(12) TaxID=908627 RepID=A0A0J1CL02_9BURK|nr:hypothetical protein EOS_35960 [Caballeronia mineralivorans PML1(12)]